MVEFNVDKFMLDMNLTNKHPEIFRSDKPKLIKTFLDYFVKYTKLINEKKTGGIENLIKHIKKEFKLTGDSYHPLENYMWNEGYYKYGTKKKNNDVYVFPSNAGDEIITLQQKYFVNCIKIENVDIDSIKVVNRNNHMMLAAESKNNDLELGKELHFKILIIYNHELKKWLVVPYKILSRSNDDVKCDSFALSASTGDVNRQYKVWQQGIETYKNKLGVLNLKYLDERYKSLPNLFGEQRSKELISDAQMIISDLPNTNKKGSVKKNSIKKGSEKKNSIKKGSGKKGSGKKGSGKKGSGKKGSGKKNSIKKNT